MKVLSIITLGLVLPGAHAQAQSGVPAGVGDWEDREALTATPHEESYLTGGFTAAGYSYSGASIVQRAQASAAGDSSSPTAIYVTLPSIGNVKLISTTIRERSEASGFVSGYIEGYPHSDFVMSYEESREFGMLTIPGTGQFRLYSAGDGNYVVKAVDPQLANWECSTN